MQTPPDLFDRELLALRRERARGFGEKGDFLHQEVASQVSERLQEITKDFTNPVIVSPRADVWASELELTPSVGPLTTIADTETLALQENSADLAIHGLSLHWSNDPVGQLVQMRRALRPDGMMLAAMFGGETLKELRIAFAEAESRIEGGISPRVAPMGEIRDLGGLIQRAGLGLPVADSTSLTVTYETPLHLMHDLRAMGETNILRERRKTPLKRATLMEVMRVYQENFSTPDGRINATFEIVFLTGWAPHESQQKPLRPGSAQVGLADVLGTREQKL